MVIRCTRAAARAGACLAVILCVAVAPARAQRKPGREFTRQGLLVAPFTVAKGMDVRLGRRAADHVRSRVYKLSDHHEVDVIDGADMDEALARAGYPEDAALLASDIRSLGKHLRADEFLIGRVDRPGTATTGSRLSADLVLMRDARLRQPLPAAEAAKQDDAAEQLAREVVAARKQLSFERRCENALHERRGAEAVQEARAGIEAYPQATIARICLLWALAPAHQHGEIVTVAQEVLAIDSTSPHALEAAAAAYDSLHDGPHAAGMWLRLAATDTADIELTERVAWSLEQDGNAMKAEPLLTAASRSHPDSLPLLWQYWRVAFLNRSWNHVIDAGEALLARDSSAHREPQLFLRLATAYRMANQPYKAVEIAARGVSRFPGDARIYALYTQFVRAEADTAIPRGLALFPTSAELLALRAKELRSRGKLAEALDAQRRAVALDSTLSQGDLVVAQTQIELGQAEDALASLGRALTHGEDSALVAQFALARGNALYRAANGTRASHDFDVAFRYLVLSDTLRRTAQSRFLTGAAALGFAQSALTEAPKLPDKARSCELARRGADMLPVARAALEAGQEVAPDAAKQSMEYVAQLDPYAARELAAYCAESVTPASAHRGSF